MAGRTEAIENAHCRLSADRRLKWACHITYVPSDYPRPWLHGRAGSLRLLHLKYQHSS